MDTPNQVNHSKAIVLVRKPIPVNPKLMILPRAVTTYTPKTKCNRLRIIGANTPKRKYIILPSLLVHPNSDLSASLPLETLRDNV